MAEERPPGFGGPGYQGPIRKPGEPAPWRASRPRTITPISRTRPFIPATPPPRRSRLEQLLDDFDDRDDTKRFGVSLQSHHVGDLEKLAPTLARHPCGLIITCGPAFEPAARVILRAADELERTHGILNQHGFMAAQDGTFTPNGILVVLQNECNAADLALVARYFRAGLFLVTAPRYASARSVIESIHNDIEAWSAGNKLTEAALLSTTLAGLRYIVTTRSTLTGWSGDVHATDRPEQ